MPCLRGTPKLKALEPIAKSTGDRYDSGMPGKAWKYMGYPSTLIHRTLVVGKGAWCTTGQDVDFFIDNLGRDVTGSDLQGMLRNARL